MRAESVIKKIWFFLKIFWSSSIGKNKPGTIFVYETTSKIENLNLFANWFSLWIELINFKISKLKHLAWKTQFFLILIQSIKWIESFIYQLASLKKFRLLKIRFSLEFFKIFEARISCLRFQSCSEIDLSIKWFGAFHNLNCLQKKLKFLANRCIIWNELKSFSFAKLKRLV